MELAVEKLSNDGRRIGYFTMIVVVMWLNGFRYIQTGWEILFSLFGYTVYLSMTRMVDYLALFTNAILELITRSGG